MAHYRQRTGTHCLAISKKKGETDVGIRRWCGSGGIFLPPRPRTASDRASPAGTAATASAVTSVAATPVN